MILRNRGTARSAAADSAPTPRHWRTLCAGLTAAVFLATPPAGTATAAPATKPSVAAPLKIAPTAPAGYRSAQLNFTELTQTQNQWCWAGTGLSVARYLGRGLSTNQNTFCDYARGLPAGYPCPNQPGELSDVQRAWTRLGLTPGRITGTLDFGTVASSIDANSPIEVGIYWTAGGGHANVLYGYDSANGTVMYADPWPASPRYGEMDYDSYVSNYEFQWAESLYGEA
ncbi:MULTISPECIES: papain-like cysteine protease family protein [unclassified Embleya]|uniref:papain-like cysteine protease family protein n=1 Tax=unclassified Embleya TaxID=2699296 RepID=UPI0033CD8CD2